MSLFDTEFKGNYSYKSITSSKVCLLPLELTLEGWSLEAEVVLFFL